MTIFLARLECQVKAGLVRHVRGLELRLAQLEEAAHSAEQAAQR